ncbi:CHY zinc finger protein [Lihuaxuella thermophila]|uniref:CHY zinc finger protein n=1 Tax=Lihuaxuella thermophila TaxID=1173111 RepID=UPI000B7E773F|nr:CHY zinc finger protein [Lihuaxuella thermophila]
MKIYGKPVDKETRCVHYSSPQDVIAVKFACCGRYYPCHACHEETADHPAIPWPKHRFHEKAVLCGVCQTELSVAEYLSCGYECPACGTDFNPGCARHYHLYFKID